MRKEKNLHHPMRILWLMSFSIGICLSVGIVGGFFTSSSVDTWYLTLNKSFLNPPGWIFGPVWTLLYVLMGLAFFGVIKQDRSQHRVKIASIWFLISLLLNLGRSIIFFALRSPLIALVEIFLLLFVLCYVTYLFRSIRKLSAYFMIPYILWVAFASFLNFSIVLLN
jgi:tryptophan-rich sensory protein